MHIFYLTNKNENIIPRSSETLELSSLTEPNRIKHEFAGSEVFQYFDVFSSSVRSNHGSMN